MFWDAKEELNPAHIVSWSTVKNRHDEPQITWDRSFSRLIGHMHPRDVHRAASIINHPAWKASDCKFSGVNISPFLPNRLADQNWRFALNFGSSRSQPYVTGWEKLALLFPPQTIEDNKTIRIWRTRKTRQTSCVLLPLNHFSYNCIFFAGRGRVVLFLSRYTNSLIRINTCWLEGDTRLRGLTKIFLMT